MATSIPVISSILPTSGPLAGGTAVTITGTEFVWVTDVRFGNTAATSYTVYSASQIIATSPAGSEGTVDITVVNTKGTSETSAADQFTYYGGLPVLTGVSPNEGPVAGGNTVTITGTNLSGATAVKFGSNASTITSVSATEIKVTAPSGVVGVTNVSVTTPSGTSAANANDMYRYRAAPVIYGLDVSTGTTAGGTTVVITGNHLDAGTATVKFGTVSATSVIVNNDLQITVVSPAHIAGTVDITVTNNGGTSATSAADQYTYV